MSIDRIIHAATKGGWNDRCLIQIGDTKNAKYYFFFRQELNVPPVASGNPVQDKATFEELKRTVLRHAIPNKGKILDYIEGKHYKTLLDWATANNRTLGDILYGVNHVHFCQYHRQEYRTLKEVLHVLDPTESVETAEAPISNELIVKEINHALDIIRVRLDFAHSLLKKIN